MSTIASIGLLPEELLFEAFDKLDGKDLVSAKKTQRSWNVQISADDRFSPQIELAKQVALIKQIVDFSQRTPSIGYWH